MNVNSELTSIANKVRALDGTEKKLGLSQMNTSLRNTVSEVSSQSQLIQEIKAALEEKAAGGGIELPKLDNPATSLDIRTGKCAIDQNGNVIEGEVWEWSPIYGYIGSTEQIQESNDYPGNFIMLDTAHPDYPCIVDPGVTEIGAMVDKKVFGNATADDVAKGKTFTSENGVQVEGTHVCSGGVTLPVLTNAGTADDLVNGKQFIDQSGNLVTGTMKNLSGVYVSNPTLSIDNYEGELIVNLNNSQTGYAPKNTWFGLNWDFIGDAKPEDVREGVTFTSKSGVKIDGTHKCADGVTLPTLENPGTADDLAENKQLIGADGSIVTGSVNVIDGSEYYNGYAGATFERFDRENSVNGNIKILPRTGSAPVMLKNKAFVPVNIPASEFGTATAADVAVGKTFTSAAGLQVTGTALIPGGGFIYPDGAFAPVTNFTNGKQYALVALIDGNYRYINTTTYNNYTMNATATTIAEDAGDYVIFSSTPVMFTAVASGDGFLLQNGSNYLHGTTSSGTALRVGTTQAVWKVDASETGGFSSGKYLTKENPNAVWLFNNSGGYNWSIKYETAGSFGYDRSGRDNTYSTGFVSFILYEYVAGEGEISPVVDTSDANVTADKMLTGYSGYANGKKVEGNIQLQTKTVKANGTVTPDEGCLLSSVIVNVPTDGSSTGGGFQVKTGQTTSGTIDTGLSSVDYFVIGKDSVTSTGLINLRYDKTNGTSYIYASAWSTNNYGTKTITTGTTALTVSGGTVTIPSSTATTGGLSSNTTYNWIAVGS